MITLNLIVLRAQDPSELVEFYYALGLEFTREQHGSGPVHYAATMDHVTLEIYPQRNEQDTTRGLRMGFQVTSIASVLSRCPAGCVINHPVQTEGGVRAVIQDPEGHRIELIEPM